MPTPSGARIDDLTQFVHEPVTGALVEQNEWIHQSWSPMADRSIIIEIWHHYINEADAHLSTVAVVEGRIAAVALISVDDTTLEASTETTTHDEPTALHS